jgi:hypothetical protein
VMISIGFYEVETVKSDLVMSSKHIEPFLE